jgi:hypothetical protein
MIDAWWYRNSLPGIAAIEAQRRREAEQRADDARPRLQLELPQDDLAMRFLQQPPVEDDDQGPY